MEHCLLDIGHIDGKVDVSRPVGLEKLRTELREGVPVAPKRVHVALGDAAV